MSRKVEFKFDVNDRVITPFGDKGIIDSLNVDAGGVRYFVDRSENSMWIREEELTAAEK